MRTSTNYGMNLPETTDNVDITKLTENFETIDRELKSAADGAEGALQKKGGDVTGDIRSTAQLHMKGSSGTNSGVYFYGSGNTHAVKLDAPDDLSDLPANRIVHLPKASGTLALDTPASANENGLMTSAMYSKLNNCKVLTFGSLSAHKEVTTAGTTITATLTVPSGCTVVVTGAGIHYSSLQKAYQTGAATVSVSGTTATFSCALKAVSATIDTYFHWYYCILKNS